MSNRMFRKNGFKLGVFSPNCSGGLSITKVPERWDASWDSNLRLAKMLDAAGIDFMLPIARWIGYGGETNFQGHVLETMTWAAALLAHTQNITIFATIHTSVNHPVVVAKQIATIDHVSGGRAGLNIVAGWNKPEYEALGLTLPDDHETRYGYAAEWFELIKKLWTHAGAFDWDGQYFKLKSIEAAPKPRARVPIINAAGSQQGREFALRNADFLFTPLIDLERTGKEAKALKADAAAQGRALEVITLSHVVCRPTEKEARDYLQHYSQDQADWAAVDNLMQLQFAHARSFPHELLEKIRGRVSAGHGAFLLIGTPEQVADGITQLHDAGLDGTTLSFVDYAKEFPYFRDHVLPILAAKGIRAP